MQEITKNIQARWNQDEVGSFASSSPKGSREYFMEMRDYRYHHEAPFIPDFYEFSNLSKKKVLEVGVGVGIDAVEIARHGALYHGIDVAQNHLDLTARHFELLTLPYKYLKLVDVVSFEEEVKFDFIYAMGVLHHVYDEEAALRNIHHMLADDGHFGFAVYSKYSAFNMLIVFSWLTQNRCNVPLHVWQAHKTDRAPLSAPFPARIRSKAEVELLLSRTGFRIVKYAKRGITPGYLPVIGPFLHCDGLVINWMGALAGWYHCFIVEKA